MAQETTFSLDELAKYDGRNGRRAYVAFKGRVYDVTDSAQWAEGEHFGIHLAGADLSAEMDAAPHGPENLDRVVPVGNLVR